MRNNAYGLLGILLSIPLSAPAQFLSLPSPEDFGGLELGSLSSDETSLSLGLESVSLPEPPLALATLPLHAAENESADPDAFKASAAALRQALDRIRADAWKGRGPGSYELPGVTHIYVDSSGGGFPALYVNSHSAGYLKGPSAAVAATMKEQHKEAGNPPRSLIVEGHYANTVFYIDRIKFAD